MRHIYGDHEASGLHRPISHSHCLQHGDRQHPIQTVLLAPTQGPSVAGRRPLHPGHGGRSGPPHPAFASFSAYGLNIVIKALYFGKEFLRMAGIVQMLHALQTPYDKYLYNANRT